jgi:hypothetical protein
MTTTKLDNAEWRSFFNVVSEVLRGKRAEIEVDSLALGSQIEAKWLPLLGIFYDPKNDLVGIALEGHDHMVRGPREIYYDVDSGGLITLEIIDAEGVQQIVRLREPLMLPSPPPRHDAAATAEARK